MVTGIKARLQDPNSWAFLLDKDNRVAKVTQQSRGIDKILKMSIALSRIASYATASGSITQKTADAATGYFEDARTVTALPNVVMGAIPHSFKHMRNVAELAESLGSSKSYEIKGESYEGDLQKVLGLVAQVFHWIKQFTYIFAFGICRPITFVNKVHQKAGIDQLSESARSVGNAFVWTMFIHHIAGVAASTLDVTRQTIAYVGESGEYASYDDDAEAKDRYLEDLFKRILELLKNGLEITSDVIKIYRPTASAMPAINLAAALGVATIDLYQVWRDTAAPAA